MSHVRAGWIPVHEIYCRTCRRMVAATADGCLADHYRFNLWNADVRGDICLCQGEYALPGMTHGMEDPATVYSSTPPVTVPDEPDTSSDDSPLPPSQPGDRFGFTLRFRP